MVRFKLPITPDDMINKEYQQPKIGDIVIVSGEELTINSIDENGNYQFINKEGIRKFCGWIINKNSGDTKIVEYLEDLE